MQDVFGLRETNSHDPRNYGIFHRVSSARWTVMMSKMRTIQSHSLTDPWIRCTTENRKTRITGNQSLTNRSRLQLRLLAVSPTLPLKVVRRQATRKNPLQGWMLPLQTVTRKTVCVNFRALLLCIPSLSLSIERTDS